MWNEQIVFSELVNIFILFLDCLAWQIILCFSVVTLLQWMGHLQYFL